MEKDVEDKLERGLTPEIPLDYLRESVIEKMEAKKK